jgi:hypothetical protein
MARFDHYEHPPESQSFPLFYIYRPKGNPVPLIPLDELPQWLQIDEQDSADQWWSKDLLVAVEDAVSQKEERDDINQSISTSDKSHKTADLPTSSDTAPVLGQNSNNTFLRLLDPESEDELRRKVYCYVPRIRHSQLEDFPFENWFIRQMMENRCKKFQPKVVPYDPDCPVQRFYRGYGSYPYLKGVFGEIIVYPDDASLSSASPLERWGSGVPLRETISAPEYLTQGARWERIGDGLSCAYGIEFLLLVMGELAKTRRPTLEELFYPFGLNWLS